MLRKRLIGGFGVVVVGALCMTALILAVPVDTPVADATRDGDIETVRSLLKQGVDVNAAQGDGMTALHWAAFTDNVEIAQMLIYAGANVEAGTRLNSITPLFMAAQNGSPSMVETLVGGGADPNATMSTGTTPLMMSAASGSVDAVKALLDAGAEPDAKESAQGQTALMFAASFNRDEAIKVLVEGGADAEIATKVVDVAERSPRRGRGGNARAATRGGRGAPGQAGAARGRGGRGAPQAAAQGQQRGARNPQAAQARGRGGRGAPQGAQAAAARGRRGRGERPAAEADPLFSASGIPISNGNVGSVRRSQARGQQQRFGGNGERVRRVEMLGGLTPLIFAARQGHTASVEALLEAGVDINQVSPADKSSPILVATINGHFDLAKLLLDRGADPKLASIAGATPLYAAVNVRWAPEAGYPQPDTTQQQTTYLDLMEALLEKGADIDAKLTKELWYTSYTFDLSRVDAAGATALWRAAQVADVDALRMLIARDADPEIANDANVKPLHVATGGGVHGNDEVIAPGGWMPAVRYLVDELGADVNVVDDSGYTPLHNAAGIGHNEMVQFLFDNGANVKAVSERGETVADMANGPRQRIQPFPETIALLLSMGSPFSEKCVSC